MKIGKVYLDFESMKKEFNLPNDALLKNIEAINKDYGGEVEITFYTNDNGYNDVGSSLLIRREKLKK